MAKPSGPLGWHPLLRGPLVARELRPRPGTMVAPEAWPDAAVAAAVPYATARLLVHTEIASAVSTV